MTPGTSLGDSEVCPEGHARDEKACPRGQLRDTPRPQRDKFGRPQAKASARATKHPDEWGAGLRLNIKTLNTKSVGRAKRPDEVLLVCLRHNLRKEDEEFRHRTRIQLPDGVQNEVLVGSPEPQVCADIAANILAQYDIRPKRADTIMGLELVFQPPEGWDCPQFYEQCLAWARQHYPHLISAVVHRDQKRPHMHLLVLAVKDQRLAGAELSSQGNRLMARRRSFNEHMRAQLGLRSDRLPRRSSTDIFISPGKGAKTRDAERRRDAALARRSWPQPVLQLVHSASLSPDPASGAQAPEATTSPSDLLAHQPPGPGDLLQLTSSLRLHAQAVLSLISLVEPMVQALASTQQAPERPQLDGDPTRTSASRLNENAALVWKLGLETRAITGASWPGPCQGVIPGAQAGTQLGTQALGTQSGGAEGRALQPNSAAKHAAEAC